MPRPTSFPLHPLVADGYPSIGCIPCTRRVQAGEGYRAGPSESGRYLAALRLRTLLRVERDAARSHRRARAAPRRARRRCRLRRSDDERPGTSGRRRIRDCGDRRRVAHPEAARHDARLASLRVLGGARAGVSPLRRASREKPRCARRGRRRARRRVRLVRGADSRYLVELRPIALAVAHGLRRPGGVDYRTADLAELPFAQIGGTALLGVAMFEYRSTYANRDGFPSFSVYLLVEVALVAAALAVALARRHSTPGKHAAHAAAVLSAAMLAEAAMFPSLSMPPELALAQRPSSRSAGSLR